ncbi:GTP-binding protein GEM [Aphelenchoides fujianensis]|nr:GTP-binding protein GEM [Aphelenchoides fujianensis]
MLLAANPPAWPYRHSSYDPCPQLRRRRMDLSASSQRFFDFDDDEEDVFGLTPAGSHSPSLRPAYNSARASPLPQSSTSSTRDVSPFFEPAPNRSEVAQLPPRPLQMRSFNVDTRGRIVDCGFRMGRRPSRPLQREFPRRNHKSRRATCPEIWLSAADDEVEEPRAITHCALRVYGAANVGKRTLVQRMAQHADHSASQNPPFDLPPDGVQLQMVVYSVDSRDSFIRAAQLLYRLHDNSRFSPAIPTVLVANKLDLQRKRKVSHVEGRMLAKIYKAAFVETSALLSMGLDALWEETLRKLQKAKANRDRLFRRQEPLSAGVVKPQQNRLVGRIVKQGRRFAKSCEEIVARLASL